ncbi:hypothetical protein PRtIB026_A29580 [Pseudomonas sp. RtIB026]|nr:hypothetical protein PRtIB026_A29580 [Pseudomonas sp. RtIB026]
MFSYSAFGHDPFCNREFFEIGFNGQLRDPEGFYILGNGHRAYLPTLSRFVSPDALSPFAQGGVNAYIYCLGDPVNRHDNSGRTPGISMKNGILRAVPKDYLSLETDTTREKSPSKITFGGTQEKTLEEHNTLHYFPGWENYSGLKKKDIKSINKLGAREEKLKSHQEDLEALRIAAKSNTPKDNRKYINYKLNTVDPLARKISKTIERLEVLANSQPVERVPETREAT